MAENEKYDYITKEELETTGTADNEETSVFGSVEGKIRAVADTFEDCDYMFANFAEANVRLDHKSVKRPTILYVLPAAGTLNIRYTVVRDYPSVQLWFLCPTKFDFAGVENECKVEAMKRLAMRFIDALNKSGYFEQLDGNIPYQVAYDSFDSNLTGVCLTPTLHEKEGVILCDEYVRRDWQL